MLSKGFISGAQDLFCCDNRRLETMLILLLCALADVVVTIDCPPSCACQSKIVLCNARHGTDPLTKLPNNIPRDTIKLLIGYNEISTIGSELHAVTNLSTFDISSNKVGYVSPDAFRPLYLLETLVLGKNRLSQQTLLPELFIDKHRLKFLDLSSNRLGPALAPNSFYYLRYLRTLLLEGNQISHIPSLALAGLGSLSVLVLRDNWLTEIPTQSWKQLSSLQEIDLSHNNFTVIRAHAFRGLNRTKELDLIGEAQLEMIKHLAFVDMTSLEVIRIQRCRRLVLIEDGAFLNNKYLREVYLQENALTALSAETFHWNKLSLVFLFDNPWHCDCHIGWMPDVLKTSEILVVVQKQEVTCWTPRVLKGHVIANIDDAYLTCPARGNQEETMARIIPIVVLAFITTFMFSLLLMKICHKLRRQSHCLSSSVSYGTLRQEVNIDEVDTITFERESVIN